MWINGDKTCGKNKDISTFDLKYAHMVRFSHVYKVIHILFEIAYFPILM
jgi:hypothetical protein